PANDDGGGDAAAGQVGLPGKVLVRADLGGRGRPGGDAVPTRTTELAPVGGDGGQGEGDEQGGGYAAAHGMISVDDRVNGRRRGASPAGSRPRWRRRRAAGTASGSAWATVAAA